MNINSTWLTINRNCNLACKWCYAANTCSRDIMPLELCKKLIDISTDCGVTNIKLIGGEPTIYPRFFELMKYLISKNIVIIVVTNGIMLSVDNFCEQILQLNYPKIHFGISLKGSSSNDYIRDCESDSFDLVIKGINNCKQYNFDYSLSYVLSEENLPNIVKFGEEIKRYVSKSIFFTFCNDCLNFENNTSRHVPLINLDVQFSEKYDKLASILKDKFALHQFFPLCLCNKEILDKMIKKKQVMTACHALKRNGLIFDTDGSILLCNHLAGFGLGKYGIDFYDADSFSQFWDSDYAIDIHKRFTRMPSKECKNCSIKSKCGGGCCIQWFSNRFEDYKMFIEKNEGRRKT